MDITENSKETATATAQLPTSFKQVCAALPSSENLRAGLVPMGAAVTLEKATLASERATLMFSCYRKADADTPEIFLDAAAAILAEYPDEIIVRVTDPRVGLPSRLKWPPQPSEIKEACESLWGPFRYKAEWNKRTAAQIAERRA